MTQSRKGSPTSRTAPRTGRRVGGPTAAPLSQLRRRRRRRRRRRWRRRRREMGAPCHIDCTQPLNLTSWSCTACSSLQLSHHRRCYCSWKSLEKLPTNRRQILVTIPNKYCYWFGQILFLLSLNQVWCGGPLCLNDFDSCFTNKESESSIALASLVFLRFRIFDTTRDILIFHFCYSISWTRGSRNKFNVKT